VDVFLTRDLETWIRDRVSNGVYTSEGHLVRQALRLLREHHESQESCPPREQAPQRRMDSGLGVAVPAK